MLVYDIETLAFLDVNDAAVDRYGYSREEFLAMTIRDIRPAEEIPRLMESAASFETIDRSSGWIHRTKDGRLLDVEISSHTVTFGDRAARFVMAQDVTERLHLEQLLRQSQRLESLGQLAGGVAHDFNNLLGVILNFALFVKESLAAAVDGPNGDRWKPVLKDVERIERAAESAARLTHQLLAFARREVIQPRALNINSVITELEPLLRRTLGEHIDFVVTRDEGLRQVLMDPGHLEQVLTNLSVNARDAMRELGGTLTIDTADIEVDEAYAGGRPGLEPGRYVRLRVSDTGSGMSKETLQRAFEPFFTTKPKGEGTGLGLATVYGIVTQAGGYISLYSELGLGTRVNILLPATDQVAAPAKSPESVSSAAGETILVVEDAEDLREVVGRILSRNGYHVIIAANGPEAIEAANVHNAHIDLLLTDVVMPQMQGKELAERITAMQPGIKVLFMSGYAQPMLGASGTLEPGVVLLEKPFTEPLLLARVRQVMEGTP
jgi:PAS domain S-box-containing protein